MPSERSSMGECARIAGLQRGLISREQALAAGISHAAMRRRAKLGIWIPVHWGVYRLWTPENAWDRWLQRLGAAALWLGGNSAASHRAAAAVWALEGVDARPVELCTTTRRRTGRAGIIVHHFRSLPDLHITVRLGIPITTVARTLLDLAAVIEPAALELAFESAMRHRLVTSQQIAEMLEQSRPTLPGRSVLASLLDRDIAVPTESALEAMVWQVLITGGLPPPVRQHEIRDDAGRLVARADFPYPEVRVAIEADGYRFHSSRADLRRDTMRQNALTRLGWIVYRTTWEDVTARSSALLEDVATLIASRSTAVLG